MTTILELNLKNENPETYDVVFSDFYTLIKNKILSEETISDKFREYAGIKLTIPVRENLIDIDYFNKNNIDTTNLYQLQTNYIKHVDFSISFASSRGFLALYPDKTLSEELQLKDMNDRFTEITEGNLYENKIHLDFLDTFIIADYIRTWMWHGRGMEYSSCLYYNTKTKDLYATHNSKGVYSVVIENNIFDIKYTLNYIINAFNRTIRYKERYLLDEVLMIPITGMHEALILNENVLEGYAYNILTEDSRDELNVLHKQIRESTYSHYKNNMDTINNEVPKKYSDTLEEVCFDKYKVPEIADMVDKQINIHLDYDKSLTECLDAIIKPGLNEDNDLALICILASYPAYATHNLDTLYAKACDSGLDKVVRLLISFSKNCGNMIDHNINKDYGFCWICQIGNLRLAKYIYSLGNVNINTTFNGSAFNVACSTNHLELAQWLYTLDDVDIHKNLSYGFILSCSRNYEEVYKWMWEIATDKERYFDDWKKSNIYINNYNKYYKILH